MVLAITDTKFWGKISPQTRANVDELIADLRMRKKMWSGISAEERVSIWEIAVETGYDPTDGMLNMTNVYLDRLTRSIDRLTAKIS